MAETRIADIIIPEVFTPYVMEKSLNQNRFFQSGILQSVERITQNLMGGGKTFNIPFWQDLTGATTVPSETVAATVDKIDTEKMIGIRQIREKVWGANNLSAALAGANPSEAIAQRVAGFWAKALEDNLIYALRGVFASNVQDNASDLINDISAADGDPLLITDANKISATATIDAVMKQGDMFQDIGAVAIHSAVYATLVKNNLIDYIKDSTQNIVFPTYMGLRLIVSDNMYRVAAGSGYKYHSYFFKAGSVGFGSYGGPIQETELFRDPSIGGGRDLLYTRRQFCIQPLGFSWDKADNSAIAPADADLYDKDSWGRVYNLKNTGVVCLISNL
jgi:hypothetical protein